MMQKYKKTINNNIFVMTFSTNILLKFMNLNKRSILLVILSFVIKLCIGQGIAIGQWRDHMPYKKCISVAEAQNKIYCATPYSLFYYDKDDESINKLSKINGLSDIGISKIRYSKATNTLVIAYSNTNIDLIRNDEIINISDIKRKTIPGLKTINDITFVDDYAYLSCGFGIVVVDLVRNEIKDTWHIGPNGDDIKINGFACDGTYYYAATDNGILRAEKNNNFLANYTSWSLVPNIPHANGKYNCINYFNGKIITNLSINEYNKDTLYYFDGNNWSYFDSTYSDTKKAITVDYNQIVITNNYYVHVFNTSGELIKNVWGYYFADPEPVEAIADKDGYIWVADEYEGLIKWYDDHSEPVIPNGPGSINSTDMDIVNNCLWVAAGGKDNTWANLYMRDGMFAFVEEDWRMYYYRNVVMLDTIFDIVSIAVNPSNTENVFAGTWGKGLIEYKGGEFYIYNETNSTLRKNQFGLLGIGGLCFDKDNNLWVTNTETDKGLSVRTPDGTWQSFKLSPASNQNILGDLIIDSYNQKWVIMPRGVGILVFNDNGTLLNTADDEVKKITTAYGQGYLPSNEVSCIAEDLDGEIWVGTDKGIAVFYSPGNVFSNQNFDAQQILVDQDGYTMPLLEAEYITAIAVDGANRKWIGTKKAGVFLVSPDGTEQIANYTTENSPLLDNSISAIAINQNTGEVFIGTSQGIVSYKTGATAGGKTFSNVYAYPNPVRENYNGVIAIKGLTRNADVKITDISGNLIYETIAEGGQALWNGRNFSGDKAKTGVYLVFCSNNDGSETVVTKILIFN
jgi:hypothetical protein